jgi:hypothetical protein
MRSAVEERCFRDDSFFESVNAAEEDLVSDYLTGKLPALSVVLFEKKYLRTAALRRRVEDTRRTLTALGALPRAHAVNRVIQPRSPAVRAVVQSRKEQSAVYARRAAMAALLLVSGSLGLEVWRLRSAVSRRDVIAATFVLERGERSGAGNPVKRLRIPRSGSVEFQMDVAPAVASGDFGVRISTPEGTEIWSGRAAGRISDDTIGARIPGKLLDKGEYIVTLAERTPTGLRTIEEYSFMSAGFE